MTAMAIIAEVCETTEVQPMEIVADTASEELAQKTACKFITINISEDIDAAVKIFADEGEYTILLIHSDFAGYSKLVCTDGFGCIYMTNKMVPCGKRLFQIHDANMEAVDKKQQLLQVTQAMYDMQVAAGVLKKHWRYVYCDVSLNGDKQGQEGFNEIVSSVCELVLGLGATSEMIQIDHHVQMAQRSTKQMESFVNAHPAAQSALRSFTVVTSDEVQSGLEPSSKTMLRLAVRAEKANAVDGEVCYLAASTDNLLMRSLAPQKYLDSGLGASYRQPAFIRALHQLDAAVQRSDEGKYIAEFAKGCAGGKGNYADLHPLLEAYIAAIEPEVVGSTLTLQGSGNYQLRANYPALFEEAYLKPNVMSISRNNKPNLVIAYFPNAANEFERAVSFYIDDLCEKHVLDGVFLWKPGNKKGSFRVNRKANIVGDGSVKSLLTDNDMEIVKGIQGHFEPQAAPAVDGHPDLVVIDMEKNAKFIQCEICEPPSMTIKTNASGYAEA